ncbi:MAG: hypothetical protein EOS25_13900 [Mesorhizobium sp.]|uniref:hypothetical protein n=1 Tax=Mesorhizobium sp. TaxID=1871066 RepID=UPI000FE4A6D1|nr:hypothetical protein [Mesorhizobium sp.]RWD51238.1 MAG: hypothetical protein EOS59_06525 [Mesorhizobium sp.]RWE60070.1 MAG: hypothetical protein EOS24_13260 [Mesorhizobium sp.]RWF11525.1 MAG: hypothetical protein EOS69_08780 [Mesorhizobium sp.]RWF18423.1 MAG: hypothetical protein EOS25_13900 [Mesorhizobium sp.]
MTKDAVYSDPCAQHKDWSHALRLDRNAALHEFEGTNDLALEMVEFIKLFLHVAFELPAAIKAKASPPVVSEISTWSRA